MRYEVFYFLLKTYLCVICYRKRSGHVWVMDFSSLTASLSHVVKARHAQMTYLGKLETSEDIEYESCVG